MGLHIVISEFCTFAFAAIIENPYFVSPTVVVSLFLLCGGIKGSTLHQVVLEPGS